LFCGLNRPRRAPSQRYRFEQFFPALDEAGISYDYRFLLNAKMDKDFMRRENTSRKSLLC
jgi:hypothetical protein